MMKLGLPAGKYVVAVSGGVDSVALLDLLRRQQNLQLIVAHFNHGIRPEAGQDERFVKQLAARYGLLIEVGHGKLGANASEDKARQARYKFLRRVQRAHGAKAIVTAHHQDDLIETALINLIRGTGWRGLASMVNSKDVIRPFLGYKKAEIERYAREHGLNWREDASNQDKKYLRNYVRLELAPKITAAERSKLLRNIESIAKNREAVNKLIATLSHNYIKNNRADRQKFSQLPTDLSRELTANWLRQFKATDITRKKVDRILTAVKTAQPNTTHDVDNRLELTVNKRTAHLKLKV